MRFGLRVLESVITELNKGANIMVEDSDHKVQQILFPFLQPTMNPAEPARLEKQYVSVHRLSVSNRARQLKPNPSKPRVGLFPDPQGNRNW